MDGRVRQADTGSGSRLALGLLLAAYTFSWVDRYIFAILMEPIRRELNVSDAQIGLVSGIAFSLAYSLAGFPFARWADRGSRRTIIALAMAAWSAITVLCGFAGNVLGLLLARGVAVCEAGCSPAAHSLISDLFPRRRRAAAFAIYGLGFPLGVWLGLSLGGLVSRAYGWRAAFVALGAPGLLIAVVLRLLLREPERGRQDGAGVATAQVYSMPEAMRLVWRDPAFLAVTFGLALLSFNGSGLQLWAPTLLLRARGADIGSVGVFTGAASGIAGVAGTLVAGVVADRFALRDVRWYLWIAIASTLILVPAQLVFLFAAGWPRYVAFAAAMFAVATYLPPLFSMAQTLLAPRLRAFGAATLLFVLNLVGPGAGPAAVGALSGRFAPLGDQAGLAAAIACSMASLVPAVLCLGYAARRIGRPAATAPRIA